MYYLSLATGNKEVDLAKFFNSIGTAMEEACNKRGNALPSRRVWTPRYTRYPLTGVNASPIPTLLLLLDISQCSTRQESRKHVHAHSGLNSKLTETMVTANQLMNGACLIFQSQDDRRFTLGLSMCATKLSLILFDRSGMVSSEQFDIHKMPKLLVRVLAGIMLTDTSTIGYDSYH